MQDVFAIEDGQQALDRSVWIALARFDVFPKDAPSILDGAQQRLLVGGTHESNSAGQEGKPAADNLFRFDGADCGVYAANLGGRWM